MISNDTAIVKPHCGIVIEPTVTGSKKIDKFELISIIPLIISNSYLSKISKSDLLAMNQYVQVSSRSAGQKVIKVTKKTAVELIVIKGQRGNNGVIDLSFYAQWDTWTRDLIYLFKNVGSGKQLPVFIGIDGSSFYLDFTNCDTGYVGLFIEGAQKIEFFDSVPV